ncbi:Response regulator rcp1 [Nodularia sphaerocarpa UHCC 0038]|nr:Response regulator rcp1 [Nodularia sphaerocarpa UHCC 0038]
MNNTTAIMPIEVLLVEDNPGDAQLTRIALEDSKISVNLNVVEDGVEAMAFLQKQGNYANAPHPDIVLLDLNLPRKDGREVLAEIKADQNFRRIPVVVLTTSQSEEDILKAYNLSANCFITKPVDFDQFVKIVQSIENFWFAIVKLPPE